MSMVSGQGKDAQKRYRERKIAVYLMKRHAGAKNEQIGELFGGISYSGVTKINKRFSREVDENSKLKKTVEKIEKELSNVKG